MHTIIAWVRGLNFAQIGYSAEMNWWRHSRLIPALLGSLLMTASAIGAERELPAELAVRAAHILTMNAALPWASALAVRNGEVVYVGDDAGLGAFIGPKTRLLSGDAANAVTVLPGLADAHAHLLGLGLSLGRIDLQGCKSSAEVIEKLHAAAQQPMDASKGEWLIGRGWDQNQFASKELPNHNDLLALDAASAGRPVLLRRIDGHAVWVNSEALRRAGIDRGPKDVRGGRILRRPDGEPTGVLIDNAKDLVERLLPALRPDEIERGILTAATYVTARGLTAVHDMGVGPDELAVYRRLAQSGKLPLRVFAYLADPISSALVQFPRSPAYQDEVKRLFMRLGPPETGPLFTLRGIKLFMDGALGSRGAALAAPYSDEPQTSGLQLCPPAHIEEMARLARLHGYQIATHAIGDLAIHQVLDAYEQAGVRAELNLRFRIEHAQVLLPTDIVRRRFSNLGVIASVQPSHATSDMEWAGARLGAERLSNAYAWRTLLQTGTRICAGSDFPVEEADPRLILHAAVTRTNKNGQPAGGFMPEQRLSVGEAIAAMTSDAAYAVFAEERLGQIRVGRPADLTLLAGELSLTQSPPPADLWSRPVLMTVVGGRVVYDGIAPSRPPAPAAAKRPSPVQNQPKK